MNVITRFSALRCSFASCTRSVKATEKSPTTTGAMASTWGRPCSRCWRYSALICYHLKMEYLTLRSVSSTRAKKSMWKMCAWFVVTTLSECSDGNAEAVLHWPGGDGHDNCGLPPRSRPQRDQQFVPSQVSAPFLVEKRILPMTSKTERRHDSKVFILGHRFQSTC